MPSDYELIEQGYDPPMTEAHPMDRYDADSRCPKCDHDTVLSIYYPNYQTDIRYTRLKSAGAGEYIERVCERCKFRWPQSPLDLPPQEAQAKEMK